jgi:hypothetical protein
MLTFIEFRPIHIERGIESLELTELLRIGTAAREVLGRLASQCQSLRWILDLFKITHPRLYERLGPWINPFVPAPESDPVPWLHANTLLDAALGGVLHTIAAEFPKPSDEARDRAKQAQLEADQTRYRRRRKPRTRGHEPLY